MADQLRADFTRAAGFPLDTMPFLDGLGPGPFERAYTPMPICAPARISLFTGRYPRPTGCARTAIRHAVYQQDLVSLLRERGYAIGLSGRTTPTCARPTLTSAAPTTTRGRLPGSRRGARCATHARRDSVRRVADRAGPGAGRPQPGTHPLGVPHRIVRDALGWIDGARRTILLPLALLPRPAQPLPGPGAVLLALPSQGAGPRGGARTQKMDGPLGEKWRWERRLLEQANPGYDDHWRRYRADYCRMLRLLDDQLRRFVRHLQARAGGEHPAAVHRRPRDYAGDYGLQRKEVGLPECLIRVPLVVHARGRAPGPAGHEHHRPRLPGGSPAHPLRGAGPGDALRRAGAACGPSSPVRRGQSPTGGEFRSAYVELGYGGLHYGEHEHPELHFRRPPLRRAPTP